MIFYANGSTDISTDIVLRDSVTHVEKTSVDVTTIDTYYHEQGAAISTKVDIAALSAATDAHEDGHGYEIGQGVYRIDWEDAAFDGGVDKRVTLIVKASGCDTVYLRVLLSPSVNVSSVGGTAQTAGDVMGAIGTPANTGGTATLAAILGNPSNVSIASSAASVLEDTGTTLPALITATGVGAITWAYTLTSSVDASAIADADVWVTSDLAGLTTVASGRTSAAGVVTFYLDAGTYYVWRQKTGWDFTNPDTEVVS